MVFDFDGAHERTHASAGFPIHVIHQTIYEPGPEGIPATSRVYHCTRHGGRDIDTSIVSIDMRALGTQGDNKRLYALSDLVWR